MPIWRTLLACLLVVAGTTAAEPVRLRTLAGQTLQGELTSVSDREVVLHVDGKAVVTPLAQVLDLEAQPMPSQPQAGPFTDIELTDGSLLHCTSIGLKDQDLELKLTTGQQVRVPLSAVTSLLNDAHDAKIRDDWQSLLAGRGKNDLLAIKDAQGTVQPFAGSFGAVDAAAGRISFETTSGTRTAVRLARVHGMDFYRPPVAGDRPAVCKVYDTAGDILAAAGLTSKGDVLSVTTPAGARVELPRSVLARLDFSRGKLTYLSSLEPLRVAETSIWERVDHYRRDRNLDNDPIHLGRDTYPRGLSLRATTELVYDIAGQYKEFRAVLGVDPGVGGESRCRVVIEGDGARLYAADVSRAHVVVDGDGREQASPLPVALNVSGVKQLRIVVTPLGLLDLYGHVALADAKVSK